MIHDEDLSQCLFTFEMFFIDILVLKFLGSSSKPNFVLACSAAALLSLSATSEDLKPQ